MSSAPGFTAAELRRARRAHGAGEARTHAFGRVFADDDMAIGGESARKLVGSRLYDRVDTRHDGVQVTRRLHGDGHAVRQAGHKLVRPDARRVADPAASRSPTMF